MADPAFVQSQASGNAADTVRTVNITPTAGNALIATICHSANNASGVTFSIADDQGNTWTQIVRNHPAISRTVEIWRAVGVAGAATVVTATASASMIWELVVIEGSGISTSSPVEDFSSDTNTSGTTHNNAASGKLDTTVPTLVVSVTACDASHGGVTPTSSFTEVIDAGRRHVQYRAVAGTLTDERCAVTTVSSVSSVGASAAFKGDAATGKTRHLMTLGVGA